MLIARIMEGFTYLDPPLDSLEAMRVLWEQLRHYPRDLSTRQIADYTPDIPTAMLPANCTEAEHWKAINMLKAYAFVAEQTPQHEQQDQAPTVSVHPLVHLAMRIWLKAHGTWEYWNEKTVARLLDIMPRREVVEDYSYTKDIWAKYVPHAAHVVDVADNSRIKGRLWLLEVLGTCETTVHRWEASDRHLREAAEQGEGLLGPEYSDTTSVSTLAKMKIFQRDLIGAMDLLRAAIAKEKKDHGETGTHTLLVCTAYLGAALNDMHDYHEAEDLLQEQLAREEKIQGSLSPQIMVMTMAHL